MIGSDTPTKQKAACLLVALAGLGQAAAAQAAYDLPPAWMPMTMLTVSLDAGNHLQVVDQGTMPAKCPPWSPVCFASDPVPLALDVYATGNPDLTATGFASFDPAQPWSVLQDKAFSRQLGWWAGSGSAAATLQANVEAAYGAGASIWIESVTQSAGLETYLAVGKYGVNADNTTTVDPAIGAYSGIFGTGGSAAKWQWDYQMDHNTYAVAWADLSPNQLYSATYKVYIGDSAGNELAAATGASTLETWAWQAPAVVPVPEPETYALMLAGLGLVGFTARRRKAG